MLRCKTAEGRTLNLSFGGGGSTRHGPFVLQPPNLAYISFGIQFEKKPYAHNIGIYNTPRKMSEFNPVILSLPSSFTPSLALEVGHLSVPITYKTDRTLYLDPSLRADHS